MEAEEATRYIHTTLKPEYVLERESVCVAIDADLSGVTKG